MEEGSLYRPNLPSTGIRITSGSRGGGPESYTVCRGLVTARMGSLDSTAVSRERGGTNLCSLHDLEARVHKMACSCSVATHGPGRDLSRSSGQGDGQIRPVQRATYCVYLRAISQAAFELGGLVYKRPVPANKITVASTYVTNGTDTRPLYAQLRYPVIEWNLVTSGGDFLGAIRLLPRRDHPGNLHERQPISISVKSCAHGLRS